MYSLVCIRYVCMSTMCEYEFILMCVCVCVCVANA